MPPPSKSFWEHPAEVLEEALSLKKQIAALQAKLGEMFGAGAHATPTPPIAGKRTFSDASRQRMATAQRARWAKRRGESADSPKPEKPARRTMSRDARARIAAAQRARWIKAKAQTPAEDRGSKRFVVRPFDAGGFAEGVDEKKLNRLLDELEATRGAP